MAEKDELLGQQVAYYRARAPEYDDWFRWEGTVSETSEFFIWGKLRNAYA